MNGGRIINFNDIWAIAGSVGLEICVSSTSFQMNHNSWPQQPRTEKVLNFNTISHDSTKNISFQNMKIKLNSRTWMTLKFSVGIFQAIELLQPH